jgi:hypothetical protein
MTTSNRLAVVLGLCLVLSIQLQAQVVKVDSTSNWKKKFNFAFNFNQAAFSSNWKAGGVNSIGLNTLLNYKASYKKDKISWDNEFDLIYGYVNNDGQGFRKTLDRIFIDSKFGYQISNKVNLFSSLNFISQFTEGFKYEKDAAGVEQSALISDLFAPAFITSAWGIEYKPVSYFNMRVSPFAPRITIVNDPTRFTKTVGPTPYGVDSTSTTRFEWLAFQLTADFNKEIAKNMTLKMRYLLFANYETLEAKTIDHRFDIMLTAKVNKFINANVGGILLYDFDQDSGVQYSQLFNLGFAYTFQNYQEKK